MKSQETGCLNYPLNLERTAIFFVPRETAAVYGTKLLFCFLQTTPFLGGRTTAGLG